LFTTNANYCEEENFLALCQAVKSHSEKTIIQLSHCTDGRGLNVVDCNWRGLSRIPGFIAPLLKKIWITTGLSKIASVASGLK
jgi:hypothetical protein